MSTNHDDSKLDDWTIIPTSQEIWNKWINDLCQPVSRFTGEDVLNDDSPFDVETLKTYFEKKYEELFQKQPPSGFFEQEIIRHCKPIAEIDYNEYEDEYNYDQRPQPDDIYQ